jgi:hypothetical protein
MTASHRAQTFYARGYVMSNFPVRPEHIPSHAEWRPIGRNDAGHPETEYGWVVSAFRVPDRKKPSLYPPNGATDNDSNPPKDLETAETA